MPPRARAGSEGGGTRYVASSGYRMRRRVALGEALNQPRGSSSSPRHKAAVPWLSAFLCDAQHATERPLLGIVGWTTCVRNGRRKADIEDHLLPDPAGRGAPTGALVNKGIAPRMRSTPERVLLA